MAEKKQGIDWSTIWKKDDWMSVWIGFLILIIFMAGVTFTLPKWGWMTDGAFQAKVPEWSKKVEALVKDAEAKDELGLKMGAESLKSALDTKERAKIGKVGGKVEKIAKEVKDSGFRRDRKSVV